MLAMRKMRVTELSEKVGITMANLSILKKRWLPIFLTFQS